MLAGRISSVQSDLGEGYIFNVMAAAVIGGISLLGGRGSIVGALGGVLLLSIIDRGLNLMQVSVFWIQSIQGFVILLAMFIDAQKARFRGPALSTSRTATDDTSELNRAELEAVRVPDRASVVAGGTAHGDVT
jgi:ribose/xylose/arabinose/galactoside ABC-type transport system permease subunit